MEYKVEINSLNNFKAWSGGLSTLNTVRERGGIDTLTTICEDLFSGNTPTEHTHLLAQDKLEQIQPIATSPLWNKSNQIAPFLSLNQTSKA